MRTPANPAMSGSRARTVGCRSRLFGNLKDAHLDVPADAEPAGAADELVEAGEDDGGHEQADDGRERGADRRPAGYGSRTAPRIECEPRAHGRSRPDAQAAEPGDDPDPPGRGRPRPVLQQRGERGQHDHGRDDARGAEQQHCAVDGDASVERGAAGDAENGQGRERDRSDHRHGGAAYGDRQRPEHGGGHQLPVGHAERVEDVVVPALFGTLAHERLAHEHQRGDGDERGEDPETTGLVRDRPVERAPLLLPQVDLAERQDFRAGSEQAGDTGRRLRHVLDAGAQPSGDEDTRDGDVARVGGVVRRRQVDLLLQDGGCGLVGHRGEQPARPPDDADHPQVAHRMGGSDGCAREGLADLPRGCTRQPGTSSRREGPAAARPAR